MPVTVDKVKEIPLFKSCFSIGRSILTLDKPPKTAKELEDYDERGSMSIVKLALDNGLKTVHLVENNMNGYLTAYNVFRKNEISLRFGVRMMFCADLDEKSEISLASNHRIIIFARNKEGYYRLLRIVSEAAKEGFYYEPRYDLKRLRAHWSDKDLLMCIPFYDSFIHNNLTSFSAIVPDISEFNPVFFLSENGLPFDPMITKGVKKYAGSKYKTVDTRSIYYENREDFVAWQVFRCIDKRTNLNQPRLDHCSSEEFSFEAWKEKNT